MSQKELPPGVNPYLLDLDPEDVAALPQDEQSLLQREFEGQEEERLSGEPEEVEAHLNRQVAWFRRWRAATTSSKSPPIAPAPRPDGRPPKA